MPRDFFFYIVKATLHFILFLLLKKTKERTDSARHSSYLSYPSREDRSVYLPGFPDLAIFSLSMQNQRSQLQRPPLAQPSAHRLEEDRGEILTSDSLFFFVPVVSSRAKMRGSELRIFYVAEHLTDYFASASSSRPLQSLVSSLKERESAQ